jgi:hypothetical protein
VNTIIVSESKVTCLLANGNMFIASVPLRNARYHVVFSRRNGELLGIQARLMNDRSAEQVHLFFSPRSDFVQEFRRPPGTARSIERRVRRGLSDPVEKLADEITRKLRTAC